MGALKASEVDAFLRNPDVALRIYLFYGPNTGLSHERCGILVRHLVDDPRDAFQMIKIDGDTLDSDPGRIIDEANTLGLFGGKRCLWIRAGERGDIKALKDLFQNAPLCPIIIEAGDLTPKDSMRSQAEACRHAVAIPSYADDGNNLPLLIDEILGESGLEVKGETRQALIASLGADRLLSRRELEKLALYCQGQSQIKIDDIDAVLSNASQLSIDSLVDAVFLGEAAIVDPLLKRALQEGYQSSMILSSLLRHAFVLLTAHREREGGKSLVDIEKSLRIFYKRTAAFRKHLSLWPASALQKAIISLGDGQLSTRQNADLATSLLSRLCLSLSLAARKSAGAKH